MCEIENESYPAYSVTLSATFNRTLARIAREFHERVQDQDEWKNKDVRNRIRFLNRAFRKIFDLANEEVYTRIFCDDNAEGESKPVDQPEGDKKPPEGENEGFEIPDKVAEDLKNIICGISSQRNEKSEPVKDGDIPY